MALMPINLCIEYKLIEGVRGRCYQSVEFQVLPRAGSGANLRRHSKRSDLLRQRMAPWRTRKQTSHGTHRDLDGALIVLDFCLYSCQQGTRRDDLNARKLELLCLLKMMDLNIWIPLVNNKACCDGYAP
jgi:hypothetical protein